MYRYGMTGVWPCRADGCHRSEPLGIPLKTDVCLSVWDPETEIVFTKMHQDGGPDRFRKKYYDLKHQNNIVFQPPTSGNSHSRWMKKFHDYDSNLHFQPRVLITIPGITFWGSAKAIEVGPAPRDQLVHINSTNWWKTTEPKPLDRHCHRGRWLQARRTGEVTSYLTGNLYR